MSANNAIPAKLWNLIQNLSGMEGLNPFVLGGGTAIALHLPYRISFDADFFSTNPFESGKVLQNLQTSFPDIQLVNKTEGSLGCLINGHKVEFFHHPYPLLSEVVGFDSVNAFSLQDLAAMKINAVTNRGSKKDFSDLWNLHISGFSIESALDAFEKKYHSGARFLAIRSLTWFEDAEQEPDPNYLNDWDWFHVRSSITHYLKHSTLNG